MLLKHDSDTFTFDHGPTQLAVNAQSKDTHVNKGYTTGI